MRPAVNILLKKKKKKKKKKTKKKRVVYHRFGLWKKIDGKTIEKSEDDSDFFGCLRGTIGHYEAL